MRILWTGIAALALMAPASAQTLGEQVKAEMPSLMTIYADLHANPELSFHEVRSASILAAEARKLGFEVTEKVGGTGVVAVMKNGAGPVVLVRADMDGLPVEEKSGLPYASKVKQVDAGGVERPVMHACGHDTHMAALIGTARQLMARKSQWKGTIVFIAQPAEETIGGAKKMIEFNFLGKDSVPWQKTLEVNSEDTEALYQNLKKFMQGKKPGDHVNIEIDPLARYVARLLEMRR